MLIKNQEIVMFDNFYKNKSVLVTGHTGFKGSWLSSWLLELGAYVYGLSKDIPTNPSMFELLNLESELTHVIGDVRNADDVKFVLERSQPDVIFHLAAQPIVSKSFSDPIETISSNVLGTSVLLDEVRKLNQNCIVVVITSDKCYQNKEWVWGYRESDQLGGKDIYSASKACAELVFSSFVSTYFSNPDSKVKLVSARAGNVIGGGDWAQDRIVVDCINAWGEGDRVTIRMPGATRPWQHVLEPLGGYLELAHRLSEEDHLDGDSFNFGPPGHNCQTVETLINDLANAMSIPKNKRYEVVEKLEWNESNLLQLNCDKAYTKLGWQSTLGYEETIKYIAEWYLGYLGGGDLKQITLEQIARYSELMHRD